MTGRLLTVEELERVLASLRVDGHGKKEILFPEGIHGSAWVGATVEENADGDGHPGFVFIEVE